MAKHTKSARGLVENAFTTLPLGSIRQQSFDWLTLYQDFPYTTRQHQWAFQCHVVNNAMALKYSAVWYRLSHDPHDRQGAHRLLETVMATWTIRS